MRKVSIIIAVCMVVAVALTLSAQVTDLSPIMKQVGPASAALTAGMTDRSMSGADVAKSADKFHQWFVDVGTFMKDKKADDAVKWAETAANAAADLSKAAKLNDNDAMKAARTTLQKQCKSCHDAHREQLPDKSFKFKAN
jgi:cytochrome c556